METVSTGNPSYEGFTPETVSDWKIFTAYEIMIHISTWNLGNGLVTNSFALMLKWKIN